MCAGCGRGWALCGGTGSGPGSVLPCCASGQVTGPESRCPPGNSGDDDIVCRAEEQRGC